MSSSIIVGPINVIVRGTGTRPTYVWIGSMGPLLLPEGAPEGIQYGDQFRVVVSQGQDGKLVVEKLLPMPAVA
jgi:hypothetical protein